MNKLLDLIGKKFGHLTVLRREKSDKHGGTRWLCECSCGNEIIMNATVLKRPKTKSCGCRHGLTPKEYIKAKTKVNENGCWIWQGSKRFYGYGQSCIKGVSTGAHVKSWLAFKGKIPKGKFVCHKCDVTSCCNPEHLFLGSPALNSRDMVKKGRSFSPKGISKKHLQGSKHHQTHLTEKDVIKIREEYKKSGSSQRKLAKKYNVEKTTIAHIIHRRTWRHI